MVDEFESTFRSPKGLTLPLLESTWADLLTEEVGEEAEVAAEVTAEEIEVTEVAAAGVEVTVGVTMAAVVHLLRITEADPEGIIVQDLDHTLLVVTERGQTGCCGLKI